MFEHWGLLIKFKHIGPLSAPEGRSLQTNHNNVYPKDAGTQTMRFLVPIRVAGIVFRASLRGQVGTWTLKRLAASLKADSIL